MDLSRLDKRSDQEWHAPASGRMRVPVVIYGDEALVAAMDPRAFEQAANVASLPGIVGASYVMPDGHWGYGFPTGSVAAFDADDGGVVSAGGVGLDIACGVRCLRTGLRTDRLEQRKGALADELFERIPAGVGSTGRIHLNDEAMTVMLRAGACWAVARGFGTAADLERTEERGCVAGARPEHVSRRARLRQREEMGTLGSGNHYLEIQRVAEVHDEGVAAALGLAEDEVIVSIHCGSRGLGYQIGSEFLREMAAAASSLVSPPPDRELAFAPLRSDLGERYLGAMRAAINCALANRQMLTHLIRQTIQRVFPEADLPVVYDVSHNTCREEDHLDGGRRRRRLFVHRKGATRVVGPGHPELPGALQDAGQPVFVGGRLGTDSWVLVGTRESVRLAWGSACHGAGLRMERGAVTRRGEQIVQDLRERGVEVRARGLRRLTEAAPEDYADIASVVEATHRAGLARKVARVEPLVCIKG